MTEARICIAEITTPHGVRGLLRVRAFTENPDDVFGYKVTREDGSPIRLASRGQNKGFLIAGIEGVADRTAAEAWRGTKLFVPRSALPETGEREYYLADLVGLVAEFDDGKPAGKVSALYDFGAGPMLEIKSKGEEPLLLPFTQSFVPTVDVAAGKIIIVMPSYVEDDEDDAEFAEG